MSRIWDSTLYEDVKGSHFLSFNLILKIRGQIINWWDSPKHRFADPMLLCKNKQTKNPFTVKQTIEFFSFHVYLFQAFTKVILRILSLVCATQALWKNLVDFYSVFCIARNTPVEERGLNVESGRGFCIVYPRKISHLLMKDQKEMIGWVIWAGNWAGEGQVGILRTSLVDTCSCY